MINFIDWRTTNLEDRFAERPPPINPKLEFNMNSSNVFANRAESSVLKNTKLPYWQKVGHGIIYRGTWSQLQQEFLTIRLLSKSLVTTKALAVPKSVNLFGKLNNQLETQLQIHKDALNREEKFQSCSVKGIVRIEKMPKFE